MEAETPLMLILASQHEVFPKTKNGLLMQTLDKFFQVYEYVVRHAVGL